MSQFYDQASLVMVPSGYKAGKVYSQKPLSTDGELTFTRNSNATRVNADGLVEKVRENYVTYSQDFSNAAWTKNTGVTLTANQIDSNGGTQAFKVDYSAANKELYQYLGSQSGQRTISVYLKGTAGETINLYDGISNSVKTLSASWQRFTITNTFSGGQYISINTYGGNARTIYVAFAQAETGDIATDYIATTSAAVSVGPTANVPRLDYSGGCPSLLLEPQRTNINTYSENFSDSSYGLTNATVSTNAAISPDGYQNADSLIDNSTSGNHRFIKAISGATISQNYTYSIWLKKGTMNSVYLNLFSGGTIANAQVDLVNGTITSGGAGTNHTIEAYANDWYRCSITGTAGDTNIYIYCYLKQLSGYVGNGDNVYLWGAQVEAGSYATSYIPTLGASVTRLADAAYKTGISSLIGQTEGTLFAEFTIDRSITSTDRVAILSDGTGNERIGISLGATNLLYAFVVDGGATTAEIVRSGTTAGTYKAAFAYKANDFAFYVNGSLIGTDTSGSVASCSRLDIGHQFNASELGGTIDQTLLFKTRLTNAQLAELTTL